MGNIVRLYVLFIEYTGGVSRYAGVYPSLKIARDVIAEMMTDEGINKKEMPSFDAIEEAIEGKEEFWQGFSDGTWVSVQEVADSLVEKIVKKVLQTRRK